MTEYTPDQYALAARLVPDTNNAWSRARNVPHVTGRWVDEAGAYLIREWQPTADTEAGRSDALVLLAAVEKYAARVPYDKGYGSDWYDPFYDAFESGSVQQIQHATFAAAVAIGAHIKGE